MYDDKKALIYKIAVDYYRKNHTQQEIANKYGISRVMVSRLLNRALTEKTVEINIYPPGDSNIQLAQEVEDKYGLKEVIVVSVRSQKYEKIIEKLGEAGANYLLRILQGSESLSISWGGTLLALVNALPKSSFPDIKIIQMIGGLGYPEESLSGMELTRRMSNAFNAIPKLLNSPGIVADPAICQALKSDPQVSSTLKLARQVAFSLVGIGHFSAESVSQRLNSILTIKDIEVLNKKGAVGDISLRFFNGEGQFIEDDINERVVGLTIDEIKNIPRKIGIAGGNHKRNTIKAALKGKLIDVLITDKYIAKGLMK